METEKNKLYVQFVSTMTPADILPGIADFLKQAKAAGLKTAVASASRNAFTVLDCLQLRSCFDYVANAAEITRTKPDPEVFLNCAAALGLPPQECIGLEDAQAGIEAINAAGMFSVGIGVQVVTREPDLAFARVEELSLDAILSAAAR